MTVILDKGFANEDRLVDIRVDLLNPIAVKVASLESKVTTIEGEVGAGFTGVDKNIANKEIFFTTGIPGHHPSVSLEGMFREGSDLTVIDGSNKEEAGVDNIKFIDSQMIKDMKGGVEVLYNWGGLVPKYQDNLTVGKTGVTSTTKPKALFFSGPDVTIDQTVTDVATISIPKIPDQMMATVSSANAPVPISSIMLDGNVGSSTILNGKLTINLPDGGGGGTLSSENFKGFFASLGDIISQVSDPKDGKSFAFAKDSKLGGQYYTPYFYVNGQWTELKQDPSLLYSSASSATPQGVFSIKPSANISIDSNGQLDLDGLSTPQLPSYFKGFFSDLDELKRSVPNPVLHQDWAYVRNASSGGLMAYRSDIQGSARLWNPIAPLGSIAIIDRTTTPHSYAQAFGIEKSSDWNVDSKGILSLKPIKTTTEAEIFDYAGSQNGGPFNKIKFVDGASLVTLDKSTDSLTFEHPQRVISYNSAWERNHSGENYRGNIFFDSTSRTWMGWADPEQGGSVGAKWTRIAHADMSLEVKDLVKRVPAKTPDVLPGILGDSVQWAYNGVTYLDSTSIHLPEDLKNVCGGYVTTTVQDSDQPGVTIPQSRIQSCAADRIEGGTWVRRFISTSSPGSDVSWSPWIRTSFSYKDIEAHQHDIGAHKEAIKYHVVFALAGKISAIFSQTAGNSLGGLHEDNGLMITDNYGYTNQDKDYMDPPYSGVFRIAGTLSFAGYKENEKKFPAGRWQILFRKKDKKGANYAPVAQFTYEHTDEKIPYPLLSFLAKDIPLEDHQEVVINISFSNAGTLIGTHPDLYLAPTRTFLVLEDNETTSGTLVAEAHRKLYGSLDVIGDVGIKSHHSNLTNPNSAIRVYGEKLDKTPKVMKYHL